MDLKKDKYNKLLKVLESSKLKFESVFRNSDLKKNNVQSQVTQTMANDRTSKNIILYADLSNFSDINFNGGNNRSSESNQEIINENNEESKHSFNAISESLGPNFGSKTDSSSPNRQVVFQSNPVNQNPLQSDQIITEFTSTPLRQPTHDNSPNLVPSSNLEHQPTHTTQGLSKNSRMQDEPYQKQVKIASRSKISNIQAFNQQEGSIISNQPKNKILNSKSISNQPGISHSSQVHTTLRDYQPESISDLFQSNVNHFENSKDKQNLGIQSKMVEPSFTKRSNNNNTSLSHLNKSSANPNTSKLTQIKSVIGSINSTTQPSNSVPNIVDNSLSSTSKLISKTVEQNSLSNIDQLEAIGKNKNNKNIITQSFISGSSKIGQNVNTNKDSLHSHNSSNQTSRLPKLSNQKGPDAAGGIMTKIEVKPKIEKGDEFMDLTLDISAINKNTNTSFLSSSSQFFGKKTQNTKSNTFDKMKDTEGNNNCADMTDDEITSQEWDDIKLQCALHESIQYANQTLPQPQHQDPNISFGLSQGQSFTKFLDQQYMNENSATSEINGSKTPKDASNGMTHQFNFDALLSDIPQNDGKQKNTLTKEEVESHPDLDSDCVICLKPLQIDNDQTNLEDDKVIIMECYHCYHEICMDSWKKFKNLRTSLIKCPRCTQKVKTI